MKRKYTYDRHGNPIAVTDEYGARYVIAPDGSWTEVYEAPPKKPLAPSLTQPRKRGSLSGGQISGRRRRA